MVLRQKWVLLCLAAILLAAVLLALKAGQYPLTIKQIGQAVMLALQPGAQPADANAANVLFNIRLPRILMALLIGASLSVAGATYQGMFKNPLVSPDILGVSAGAGLGASLAIWFNMPFLVVQLAAFAAGVMAVLIVVVITSKIRAHDSVLVMVLTGITVAALFGAAISLIKIVADPYTQLSNIVLWLLGSLNDATMSDVTAVAPFMLVGLLIIYILRWKLNLLCLGDAEAQTLGLDVKYYRWLFILLATLITSCSIAVAGIIGWVGLVVPHAARLIVGANFKILLPTVILAGAIFLLISDTLARTLVGIEVPLGVVTAFFGAPCFLGLLLSGGKQ